MKKLAVIDHYYGDPDHDLENRMIELLFKIENIEYDIAPSLGEFEKKFGSLDNYVGAFVHPGLDSQEKMLRQLHRRYPQLRMAICSRRPEDYLDIGKTAIIGCHQMDKIKRYFRLN